MRYTKPKVISDIEKAIYSMDNMDFEEYDNLIDEEICKLIDVAADVTTNDEEFKELFACRLSDVVSLAQEKSYYEGVFAGVGLYRIFQRKIEL